MNKKIIKKEQNKIEICSKQSSNNSIIDFDHFSEEKKIHSFYWFHRINKKKIIHYSQMSNPHKSLEK
jgi:hypothetical protein